MPTEQTEPVTMNAGPFLSQNEIVPEIRRVLSELNKKNAVEIANYLHSEGVEGKRRDGCNCPISNYIRKALPWAYTVMVTSGHVSAYPKPETYMTPDLSTIVQLERYDKVRDFILNFDSGYYSFLLTSN